MYFGLSTGIHTYQLSVVNKFQLRCKWLTLFVVSFLLFLWSPSLALAVTVNPGSSIQTAINGGQDVIVKAGTYNERLNINKNITVTCETKHACIIKGAVLSGNATLDGFYSLNSDTNDGGLVANGSGNVIKNNKVEGSCMLGVKLDGSSNLAEGNEIFKSHKCSGSSGPDSDGMRFFGSNQVLRGNYIHDISFNQPDVANTSGVVKPPHIDCFQTFGGATNATIENNICDNYYAVIGGVEGTQGANLENCDGCRFYHNYIHVYGKSVLWEGSSSNGKAEYNILVSGPVISGTNSGQYGLFGNATVNYNLFSNFKNGGAEALVSGAAGTGNVKNAGDLKLDSTYHPLAGSPACSLGGSYVGVYPCGSGGGSIATPASTNNVKTGDVNRDGAVNVIDIGLIIDNYGKSASTYPKGDLNTDNTINIVDIGIIISNYGK